MPHWEGCGWCGGEDGRADSGPADGAARCTCCFSLGGGWEHSAGVSDGRALADVGDGP